MIKNRFRLAHPTVPTHATRKPARFGADQVASVFGDLPDVALDGWFAPHRITHCRGDQNRGNILQVQRADQVVGDALSEFGDQVRRRRCDDHQVDVASQFDVGAERMPGRERFGDYRATGQRGEGGGTEEFGGRPGHRGLDTVAGLDQAAAQCRRFVGCDPTADRQQDSFGRVLLAQCWIGYGGLGHTAALQIRRIEIGRFGGGDGRVQVQLGNLFDFVIGVKKDLVLQNLF